MTNTGNRTGTQVVQVYVTDPASVGEPPVQLKGFAKVTLRPGQHRHVQVQLDEHAFAHWDTASQSWQTTPGRYTVSAGTSSRDLPLSVEVVQ